MIDIKNAVFITLLTLVIVGCQSVDDEPLALLPNSPSLSVENEYYVSISGADIPENGSAERPWKSIQYGADQLKPGDKLFIKPGVYEERLSLHGSSNSGAPDNPITIEAQPGAIIDGSSLTPNGRDALIAMNSVSHVKLDGFELRNFKTEYGFNVEDMPIGILIIGDSTDLEISNNTIHHIENNSSCKQSDNCGPAANGIGVYGNTVTGIKNISLLNNEVYNCRTSSSEVFVLNGNVDGFKIIGNHVHDNNNIGFDFIGLENSCSDCSINQDRARNGIVVGNRAIGNSTGNNGGNPWYGDERSAGGIYVDGGTNIIIDRNWVSGNDLGIEIASEAPGGITSDILVTNNLVIENKEAGLLLGGYSANAELPGGGAVGHIYVHNNTFYKNRGWGTDIVLQNRVSNSQFYNNIVFTKGDVSNGAFGTHEGSLERSDLIWSHNQWWGDGKNDGAPVFSPTSIISDPMFEDADGGQFRLLAKAPAINSGATVADIPMWSAEFWMNAFPDTLLLPVHGTKDFDESERVQGLIDIGAFEQ